MAREKFGANVRYPASRLDLSSWALTRVFSPFFAWLGLRFRCDAEPGALADYILALLKHNAAESELRVELGTQLEEFLEKGAFFYSPPSSPVRFCFLNYTVIGCFALL